MTWQNQDHFSLEHDDDDEGPSAEDLRRFGGDETICEDCGASLYDDVDLCPECGTFQISPELTDRCGPARMMRNPWVLTIVVLMLVYAMVSWYM